MWLIKGTWDKSISQLYEVACWSLVKQDRACGGGKFSPVATLPTKYKPRAGENLRVWPSEAGKWAVNFQICINLAHKRTPSNWAIEENQANTFNDVFWYGKKTGSEKWCLQGMESFHQHPEQPGWWGGFREEHVNQRVPGGDAEVFNFNVRGQRGSGLVHEEQGLDFSIE